MVCSMLCYVMSYYVIEFYVMLWYSVYMTPWDYSILKAEEICWFFFLIFVTLENRDTYQTQFTAIFIYSVTSLCEILYKVALAFDFKNGN